jgi:hypothetical protein
MSVEVDIDQYVAIYEALQCFVRFEEPCELERNPRAMVVRDRAGRSDRAIRFVLREET